MDKDDLAQSKANNSPPMTDSTLPPVDNIAPQSSTDKASPPSPTESGTSPNPAVLAPTFAYGMSGNESTLIQRRNPKRIILKVLAYSVITLAGIVGILAGLVFTGVIALSKFKTIQYNNGVGDSYSLKFYSHYSIKNVKNSTSDSSDSGISDNLAELVAGESADGKYPLTLWIETAPNIDNTAQGYSSDDCSKYNMSKAFTIKIDYINSDVVVCGIQKQGVDLVYLSVFHKDQKGYMVYIAQDVDFAKLLSNPENARDGLAKINLKKYQDDIREIVASIRPLD